MRRAGRAWAGEVAEGGLHATGEIYPAAGGAGKPVVMRLSS